MAMDSSGKKLPWLKIWTCDLMADPALQVLSWENRGRYLWGLFCSWETDDPGSAYDFEWAAWMGLTEEQWAEQEDVFCPLFRQGIPDITDGSTVWTQKRLVKEYAAARDESDRLSAASKKANSIRWDSDRTPVGLRPPIRSESPPAPALASETESKSTTLAPDGAEKSVSSPKERQKRVRTPNPVDVEWEETFHEVWWPDWLTLGRKCSKGRAFGVWAKVPHSRGQADFDDLDAAFEEAKAEWIERNDPQFIPHADKWLRDYISDLEV